MRTSSPEQRRREEITPRLHDVSQVQAATMFGMTEAAAIIWRMRKVTEIAIFTRDVPATRRFYEALLDSPPDAAGPRSVEFQAGEVTLRVHVMADLSHGAPGDDISPFRSMTSTPPARTCELSRSSQWPDRRTSTGAGRRTSATLEVGSSNFTNQSRGASEP